MTRSGFVTLTLVTFGAGAPATAVAFSRLMSLLGLSVRTPRNVGWRTCPSGVHSEKATSTTISGLTQRSLPVERRDQRPGLTEAASTAGCVTSSLTSCWWSSAPVVEDQPVPTEPP